LTQEFKTNSQSLREFPAHLAVEILTQRDRDLAAVIQKFGYPPQWRREPGFSTLIQIILEQQVSLASAQATFNRLLILVTERCIYSTNNLGSQPLQNLTPQNFLSLDDLQLKAIGFSRQKISYTRELAKALLCDRLNLQSLESLDDLTIRNQLKQIKGIGDWTVDMYLMMALQRPDIFPSRDLAVAIAVKELKNLLQKPTLDELALVSQSWQPYRSTATQILWHYYLNYRKSKFKNPFR
jgi:DNA-3-methyladenine glycosylase II